MRWNVEEIKMLLSVIIAGHLWHNQQYIEVQGFTASTPIYPSLSGVVGVLT
jgi:hypothetical protein